MSEAATTEVEGGHSDRADDRGVTLVEILVSVALMATVVVALIVSMLTLITASSTAFDAADTETALLNAADRIRRADQKCDYDAELLAEVGAWDAAATMSASIRILETYPTGWVNQPTACIISPLDVQEVTITASHSNGNITRSVTVMKSNED